MVKRTDMLNIVARMQENMKSVFKSYFSEIPSAAIDRNNPHMFWFKFMLIFSSRLIFVSPRCLDSITKSDSCVIICKKLFEGWIRGTVEGIG